MLISSVQTNIPTLAEPKEHISGCQCPACCKKAGSTEASANKEAANVSQTEETSSTVPSVRGAHALSSNERQHLMQLQQRDSEVRSHEAAHIAAGGSAVSGAASFTYQKGPDGKLYAIGGEVPISASGGSTPQEKIAIAKQVQAGALAPANPSPQDIKVASSAAMMEARARQELAQEKSEEKKEKAINTYGEHQNNNNDRESSLRFQWQA